MTLRVLFTAAVVAVLGCGGSDAAVAETESDTEGPVRRTVRIDPNDMGDIDAVSLRLEDLVAVGDVAGIEDMWLEPDELAGCRAGGIGLPNEDLESFLTKRREEFRARAEKTLGHGWSGTLVYTHHLTEPPEIMGRKLLGGGCRASAFGRVWVYVRRSKGPRLVEHRFNVLRVGDQWRVFRYRGMRARCKDPRWADGPACERLANSRPKR